MARPDSRRSACGVIACSLAVTCCLLARWFCVRPPSDRQRSLVPGLAGPVQLTCALLRSAATVARTQSAVVSQGGLRARQLPRQCSLRRGERRGPGSARGHDAPLDAQALPGERGETAWTGCMEPVAGGTRGARVG